MKKIRIEKSEDQNEVRFYDAEDCKYGLIEKRHISKGALKRLEKDSYAYCFIQEALI